MQQEKNAADIAIAVDVMDCYYQGIRHFCIASTDSDFTPLVLRLREAGCFVIGIGKPEAHSAFKNACHTFVSTDQLLPLPARTKTRSSTAEGSKAPPAIPVVEEAPPPFFETRSVSDSNGVPDTDLVNLLTAAYRQASTKGGNEWVPVSQFGTALQQLRPGFTPKNYGCTKLKQLIEKYPHIFQTQPQKAGHISLRLKGK